MLQKWLLSRRSRELERITGISLISPDALTRLAELRQLIIPSSLVFYAGQPLVRQYFAVQDQTMATRQNVLHVAASLIQPGQHPILQAIRTACAEEGLVPREAEMDDIEEYGGLGRVDRTWYVVGNEDVMTRHEIELGVTVTTLARQFELEGKYTVFLAQRHPKRLLAIFACEFELIPGSGDTVVALREMGVESILLTGAKTSIAKGLGNRLSLSLIHSELGETEKERIVASLTRQQPNSAILIGNETGHAVHSGGRPFTIGVNGARGSVSLDTFDALPGAVAEARLQAKRGAVSLLKS